MPMAVRERSHDCQKISSADKSGAIIQEMAATRFANRETLREAARLCTRPLRPALAISGWAARRADTASSLLPLPMASSTRRIDERIWLR